MQRKYSNQAEKFLSNQNDDEYERLKTAIAKLPKGDVKKMKGFKDKYRLRVGNVRVIFNRVDNAIYIEIIDYRGQVYKR